jgi:integrase
MRLTDASINSLNPDGRDRLIFDNRQPGFGLRLTPAGSKIFVAQGRVAGRKRRVTLGYYPNITVAKAREDALQVLADMRRGCDPLGERKARLKASGAGVTTVNDLLDKWTRDHVEPKLKPRTASDYTRLFTRHIRPALGHLSIATVTRDDINRMHVKMRATSRRANYAVTTLRALFNFAIDLGLRPAGSNPTKRVKLYRERIIERPLTEAEIGQAADGINKAERTGRIGPHAAAGLRIAMLTGARASEVTAIQWPHIHWERRLVRLPDSKAGTPRIIHLSDAALEVLKSIPRISKFVIAGRNVNEPYCNLTRAWIIAREYAGLCDVRLHDLRHNFASLAGSRGASLQMIGRLLGHRTPTTTLRYVHLVRDAVSDLNDDIGAAMTAAISGRIAKPADNVMRLKRRQAAR